MANNIPDDVTFTKPAGAASDVTFTKPNSAAPSDMSDVTFEKPQANTSGSWTPAPQRTPLENLAGGVVKAVAAPAVGVMNAYSRARAALKGETPSPGTMGETEAPSAARNIGEGIGEAGEFVAGGEVLGPVGRFLKLAEAVPELLPTLEKYPKATKMLLDVLGEGTKGAAVGAGTGAAQASAEGKDVKKGAESGAIGGGVGGAAAETAALTANNATFVRGLIERASGVLERHTHYGSMPARALLRPDMPLWAGLTNGMRVAAARNLLDNKVMPAIESELQNTTAKIPRSELLPAFQEAEQSVQKLYSGATAKDALRREITEIRDSILQQHPNPLLSASEMNTIRQGMHLSGANYESRADASDIIKNLYRGIHDDAKNSIIRVAPKVKDLLQQASDLIGLKDAAGLVAGVPSEGVVTGEEGTMENLGGGKTGSAGRGSGPMSGMGWVKRTEAALGHVAPNAARTLRSPAAKGTLEAAGANLEEKFQPAEKVEQAVGRLLFRDSAGNTHTIPEDQLQAAQQVDPHLTVLGRVEGAAGAAKDAFLHGRPTAEPATDTDSNE